MAVSSDRRCKVSLILYHPQRPPVSSAETGPPESDLNAPFRQVPGWHVFWECLRYAVFPLLLTRLRMQRFQFNAFQAVGLWLITCLLVYLAFDLYATRRIPIHVEQFRQVGMGDEQVLSLAVQEAYRIEDNLWWINDKQPYLVFDKHRRYQIHPNLYAAFDLQITTDHDQNPIGLIRPTLAAVQRP